MSITSDCIICHHPTHVLYSDIFDDRHGYPENYSIMKCTSCGFCHTEPSLNREDLAAVYQRYYPRSTLTVDDAIKGYDTAIKTSKWMTWLDGKKTDCYRYIVPGTRVLDVGCGNCVSLLMARHLGALDVVGIEVDPTLRDIAKELGLNVHIGQVKDLPIKNGSFDNILAQQVLEHEPDPKALLYEMRKRLNRNGRIVMSFPHVNSLYRLIFRRKWLHWHVPYHINHFSIKSVRILARQCGLKIESIKTVTPNPWMQYQIRRLRFPVTQGQRDTFWDPGQPALPPSVSWPIDKLISSVAKHMLKRLLLTPITCLANRSFDALRLGESIVVVLMEYS